MYHGRTVTLVIPALDEEASISDVLDGVDRSLVDTIIVADNGSTDSTAERARAHGAVVVREARRGYGSACLTALREVADHDIFVFMDADGSDDPTEIDRLLDALRQNDADIVIGSRVLGNAEPGALTPIQRFGNALTCTLVRWFWGVRYTDLGPFRAVRAAALRRLDMRDPDFGWTIEMQVKAAQHGMKVVEVPVSYRVRRAGRSKVSGTLSGSWNAGRRILGYVLSAKLRGDRRS